VLEFIPARFELHIHVLPKYACSRCRDGVVAPDGPQRPVSGCIAGAGLLAEVAVSKFAEHLPHYRWEDISTRYGLYLPRSTLCDWVRSVADLLKPLYELQKDLVRTAPVIWTDDTYVTFLGGVEPGSHTGRFWVYIGPGTMPSAGTTGFTRARTARSWKWPAGRMRVGSSSRRGRRLPSKRR
jgi:transposase